MPNKAAPKASEKKASEDAGTVKATKVAKPAKGNKPNALQQPLQPGPEGVQVQHVRGGIGHLLGGQLRRAPIGALLLLR